MKETKDQIKSLTINFNLSLHADHEVYDRLNRYISSESFFDDKEDVVKYLIEEGLDSVTNKKNENKSITEVENTPSQIFEYQSKPSVFTKGQIWFWNDPVYGYKTDTSRKPVAGDATIRYNRHVIIVQEPNTLNSLYVLVVPLSSHPNDPYDVLIHKIYNGGDDISYARTNLVYPVHVNQLKKYLCMASSECMAIIMLRISQLFHGNIISSFISRYIANNMKIDIPSLIALSGDEIIDEEIIDECEDEEFDVVDVVDGIKASTEEIQCTVDEEDKNKPRYKNRGEYKKSESRLIKVNKKIPDPKITKSSQWSRIQKVEFYNYYIMAGTKATAEKYNLKEGSVYTKISNIKTEIQQGLYLYQDDDSNDNESPEVSLSFDLNEKYINSPEFRAIVSDFSRYIRYRMSMSRSFEKFKTNSTKSTNNNFIYFYDHISSGIYISLMTMLGLMESLSNPKLKEGNIDTFKKYKDTIDTLREFGYLNKDKDHVYMNYCDDVMYNINNHWKDFLLAYFNLKFNKNSYNLYELTNEIVSKLCGKNQ